MDWDLEVRDERSPFEDSSNEMVDASNRISQSKIRRSSRMLIITFTISDCCGSRTVAWRGVAWREFSIIQIVGFSYRLQFHGIVIENGQINVRGKLKYS